MMRAGQVHRVKGALTSQCGSDRTRRRLRDSPFAAPTRPIRILHPTGGCRANAASALAAEATVAAPAAATEQRRIHLPHLFHTLFPSPADKRVLLLCLLTNVVSVATYVIVAPCLGNVIDVISASPKSTYTQLAKAVGMLAFAYVLSNTSLAAQVQLASSVGERLAKGVRTRLFYGMMVGGEGGRARRRDGGDGGDGGDVGDVGDGGDGGDTGTGEEDVTTGSKLSWLTNDIGVLQTTVTKLLGARGIRSGLETIAIIGVLLYLNWVLALMLLISAPVLTPLVLSAAKTIKVQSEDVQETVGNAAAAAVEIIENQKVIKANQGEATQVARYDHLIEAQSASNTKLIVFQSLLDVSGRLRNVFCVLLTVGLGAHLALMNQVTVGTCYSFFIYGFGFAFALSNVAQSVGEISKVVGALKNCYDVLLSVGEVAAEVDEADGADELFAGEEMLDIEFRNVSFSHPDGWTMRDISFKMPAGTTTALVGPSGGGKSTIASLLLGFHRPSSGDIYVNGRKLSEIDVRQWRKAVGVVEQRPGLLVGRVKDVVRYGNEDLSDGELYDVLRASQALEFVSKLPDGEESVVSQDKLSGGQGQRLALARALGRKPKLLVLDEATSALDTETESKLELGVHPATTLVIAHRLTTVRDCDNIVVVRGGRVVGEGGGREFLEGMVGGLMRGGEESEDGGFYSDS